MNEETMPLSSRYRNRDSHRAILIAHESIEFVVEQCIRLFQISPR